jgi:hypothetical protein
MGTGIVSIALSLNGQHFAGDARCRSPQRGETRDVAPAPYYSRPGGVPGRCAHSGGLSATVVQPCSEPVSRCSDGPGRETLRWPLPSFCGHRSLALLTGQKSPSPGEGSFHPLTTPQGLSSRRTRRDRNRPGIATGVIGHPERDGCAGVASVGTRLMRSRARTGSANGSSDG